MRFRKFIAFFLVVLFSAQLSVSQTASTKPDPEQDEKKKETDELIVRMLDQAVADAAFLRLPGNKAIVFGMAGDLYWKYDEKRSRDLFRSAGNEMLAYNLEYERERRENGDIGYGELFDMYDPRGQVLPLVAKNDAELALDMLSQTRPAALAEAMLKAAAPDARSDATTFSPETQRVRQEIALEQRFALLAADENPDRAIKIIKDSLSRGVSNVVLQLLQKIHKKDEKKAQELAGDVVRKFVDTDLAKKTDELQAALSFLQMMARSVGAPPPPPTAKNRPFAFSDIQSKDLANKIAATFLAPSNSMALTSALSRALPDLEKLVPDKAATLRQRLTDSQKSLPNEMRESMRLQNAWNPNSTPEQILAEIPRMTNEMMRSSAYQNLASKIAQLPDEARAKKLIDQIPDDKVRARALEQFESAKISRLGSSGKLEDARKLINGLSDKKLQVQKLVGLALSAYKKDSEPDVEIAKGLMKEARAMINEVPEDEDELASLMEVVRGYATVEPDAAFRLFDPTIEQFNDVIHATAILSKYNKRNRSFKKGEMVLRATGNAYDGIPLFRYLNQIQLLGKADLARTNQLTDRFQRSDARTLIKLIVVQGFLKDERKPEAYAPVPFGAGF